MAICPKCGYRFAKYELRSAGTRSKTKYYRNGIHDSFFISVGKKKYASTRLQKTVGFCPECGYYWENGKEDSFFTKNGLRILLFILYFGISAVIGDTLFPSSTDSQSTAPDWFIVVSFLLSIILAFAPGMLKKVFTTAKKALVSLVEKRDNY